MLRTNLILAIQLLLYELINMKSDFKKYWEDRMNYIDFFGLTAGIVWISYMLSMGFVCEYDSCQKFDPKIEDKNYRWCTHASSDENHLRKDLMVYLNIIWSFSVTIRATDIFSLFD